MKTPIKSQPPEMAAMGQARSEYQAAEQRLSAARASAEQAREALAQHESRVADLEAERGRLLREQQPPAEVSARLRAARLDTEDARDLVESLNVIVREREVEVSHLHEALHVAAGLAWEARFQALQGELVAAVARIGPDLWQACREARFGLTIRANLKELLASLDDDPRLSHVIESGRALPLPEGFQ